MPLKINPFAVSKAVEGICGDVKNVTRLRSGSLLIECARRQQSINLLKAKHFANIPITVSVHKSLNSCRGIIRDRANCLSDMSEEDITQELTSQGVTSVKRFTRKDHDRVVRTNTYLVTFALSKLPDSIKAGYFNIGVDVFIPNPLRCFKCQKFGHGAKSCHNNQVCSRCSKNHDSTDCTGDVRCANCNGEHMSSSKSCPVFERETKIIKVKYTNNISFADAKKLVAEQSPTNVQTRAYSTVVTSSKQSVACQTAICWVTDQQTLSSIEKVSSSPSSATQTDPCILLSEIEAEPESQSVSQPQSEFSKRPSRKDKKHSRQKESNIGKYL